MNGPHFKHGKLATFVTCKWNHALPHLLPIAALGSIRTVAARHGIQFRTRSSTEPGMKWLFIRPNKKAPALPIGTGEGQDSVSPRS